jgi:cytochrome b561
MPTEGSSMTADQTAAPGLTRSYSRASIALHWLMLVLLAAVFACIELRENYPRGSDIRAALKTWHFMLGLSVFVLVWIRLIARWRTPWLAADAGWTRWPAAAVHLLLYGGMIVLPLLGWLILSAEGAGIPFFGLSLPPLIAPDKALAGQLEDLHKTIGETGYWLISLHALASVLHHHLLKDGTLRRMLPFLR